jgi:ribosomal protein S20
MVLKGKYQTYMKAVKEKLEAKDVEAFEKGAAAYAKKVVSRFKDFEFVRIFPVTYDELYNT